MLYEPYGIAVDASGDLFIADTVNNLIREVKASTKDHQHLAGNGTGGYSGDGGLATAAELFEPYGPGVDAGGDLFIADYGNNVIREVTASTHDISTVAGNGTAGYSGDGGLATSAELTDPFGIAVDSSDDLFIADTGNNRVRKVTASSKDISTLAGNGTAGDSGDGGLASSAEVDQPGGVALDSHGNLFIADYDNNRVREFTASTKDISTVAGGGLPSNVPPTSFSAIPYGVALDSHGNLFIANATDDCIDEVLASTGEMITYAGDGIVGL